MITTTPNLELTKDSTDEFYDVTRVNANMDKIDAAVAAKADKSELPNIHKNPAATTGDIIDTHLTVGAARAEGTIGSGSFVSGGMYGGNLASGINSAASGGNENTASGLNAAVTGGNDNTSKAANGVITGGAHNLIDNTSENSNSSAIVGGEYNTADGFAAAVVGGIGCKASSYQSVTGKYNAPQAGPASAEDVDGSLFMVGDGTSSTATSNAFRISAAGVCYGTSSFRTSGADFAEFFEWLDGNPNNEDRRGLLVTLDGEKIKLANVDDDYILGAVSSTPTVTGDTYSEIWHGMYKKDVFGADLIETVEVEEKTDEETGEAIPAHTEKRFVLNPDYDPTKEYVSRDERPEWAAVGVVGKLVVVDDGTCEPNGYCAPSQNGIVTAAGTGYRVLSRIDDTHVKILVR